MYEKEKWTQKDWLLHMIMFILSLIFIAFGVAFSIKANLGTSPISSLPYVVSQLTSLSVGNATIIFHSFLIVLQMIILRRNFERFQLLQLPVAIFFGKMTDIALNTLDFVQADSYFSSWILCIIGIFLVAIGVTLEVSSKIITLAGEGLILAICFVLPASKFGTMKIIVDVSMITLAAVLGLVMTHQLIGVREGTVAAAILVGLISKQLFKLAKVLKPTH